jgi:serine/threonine protein kinase
LVKQALANNSHDNLTCQLLRIEQLPADDQNTVFQRLTELPFPPPLDNGMRIDGYRIIRQLHASKRTELYLAVDEDTDKQIALKAPSINYIDDPTFIEQFQHEEWAGRRISNPHILRILEPVRPRKFLYCIAEYIEGQTLRQWMHDHPRPQLDEVRAIIEQIANGLRAMHKLEMIHQDLKPDNIMIDRHGMVKIIDLGSTKIAGIQEINSPVESATLLGTVNYTAPEYVRGLPVTNRSDIFSLGVITYEMLTGELPYGEKDTHKSLSRITALDYLPATKTNPEVPAWVDGALKKATHPDPHQRYEILSGFLYDLSHPNTTLVIDEFKPLLEKNPLAFWKGLALLLAAGNIILLYLLITEAGI